jgi:carboxypeptidase Q
MSTTVYAIRMRKFTAALFLACALSVQAVDQPTYDKIKAEEMEHSQIMHTLHVLTDRYGPRLTGSPNFENAANWVVK